MENENEIFDQKREAVNKNNLVQYAEKGFELKNLIQYIKEFNNKNDNQKFEHIQNKTKVKCTESTNEITNNIYDNIVKQNQNEGKVYEAKEIKVEKEIKDEGIKIAEGYQKIASGEEA